MAPSRLVEISSCISRSSDSSIDWRWPRAALLTRISTPWKCRTIAPKVSRTAAGSEMSGGNAFASGPISWAVASRAAGLRDSKATRMPSFANAWPTRFPSPRDAPVTTATLSSMRYFVSSLTKPPASMSDRVPRRNCHRWDVLIKARLEGGNRVLANRFRGPPFSAMQRAQNARLAEQIYFIGPYTENLSRDLLARVARQVHRQRWNLVALHSLELLDARDIVGRVGGNVGSHGRPCPGSNTVGSDIELCHVHCNGFR